MGCGYGVGRNRRSVDAINPLAASKYGTGGAKSDTRSTPCGPGMSNAAQSAGVSAVLATDLEPESSCKGPWATVARAADDAGHRWLTVECG